jgi:hypothetical protein
MVAGTAWLSCRQLHAATALAVVVNQASFVAPCAVLIRSDVTFLITKVIVVPSSAESPLWQCPIVQISFFSADQFHSAPGEVKTRFRESKDA